MTWSYWNQIVQDASGNALSGRNFTVWTAETSGTQLTSTLRTWAGATVSGGVISSESDGQLRCKETSDTYARLWAEGPDSRRYPMFALEAIGAGTGGNVSDNTSETITGAWTFSTNPTFNNGAITQAKVVNLTTDLAAAANPVARGTSGAVANQAAMLALTANVGDWTYRTDTATVWMLLRGSDPTTLANWVNLGAGSGSGSVGYDGLPAGVAINITAASTTARPTARTDIPVKWWTTDGVFPANAISGDEWTNALVVVP